MPYLRTRLAEVYREAEQAGTSPADTHRLLVVGLPRRSIQATFGIQIRMIPLPGRLSEALRRVDEVAH